MTPEEFKKRDAALTRAIDDVAARLRYWALAARRRRKKVDYLQGRYEHFIEVGRQAVKEWRAAEKKDDREAMAKAKRRTKRAHRKAAYFSEQVDDASQGLQKAVARRKRQKRKLRLLKKIHRELPDPVVQDGDGRVIYDGRPAAGWLAAEFQEARERGLWGGTMISGVRTPEQSRALCFGICGRESCPGLCAGTASNHNCTDCHYPHGAGDCTDGIRCTAASHILGNRYTNDLPLDRPHQSATGH